MTTAWPVDGGEGISFRLGGETLRLAPFTGWQAFEWAANGAWRDIVPAHLEESSYVHLAQRLSDRYDAFSIRHAHTVAVGLAEEIYGVPWWAAMRLCATAKEHQRNYLTWAAGRGLNPHGMSAVLICHSVLSWIYESCETKEERLRFESRIFTPPAGPQRAAATTSVDDFVSQMKRMGSSDDD